MSEARSMAVPLTAVRTDRARPYVQLVRTEGDSQKVVHQSVELGIRGQLAGNPSATQDSEQWVAVTGLEEGSTVILGQLGSLREGLVVKPLAAKP